MLKQYFLVPSMLLFGLRAWLVLLLTLFISSVVCNKAQTNSKEKYQVEKNVLILLQFYTNSDLSHITKCSVDKVFMLVIFESVL